jgi:hypothetical protein
MARAAFILSVFGFAASVLALAATQSWLPRTGVEWTLLFGGVLLWLSALFVALTLALCFILVVKRRGSKLVWPLAYSVCAIALLLLDSGLLR